MERRAYFHLPGLFEFYDLYSVFLPLYHEHREYFYDWCGIGSLYGAPGQCLWGGGRVGFGDADTEKVRDLVERYSISPRLTFSNSLLKPEHLCDPEGNALCALFEKGRQPGGIIICSDLLMDYIRERYPGYYFISSTTKVITGFADFQRELNRPEFLYTVPDFRLNKRFDKLKKLSQTEKDRTEFLINECCNFSCRDRKACYESVSRKTLGMDDGFVCTSPDATGGYVFSKAKKNPGFISVDEIRDTYLPMGFSNFKIEGRGLGSALILEFLLYYMTKPEYQLNVREAVYLDNELDLF